jgi:glycosyltransferase involved in cell wall biosynthesis
MNIAFFAHNSPRHYSGGRYYSWMMAEALASQGHQVAYITNNRPVFLDDFNAFPAHRQVRVILTADFLRNIPSQPFDLLLLIPHVADNNAFFMKAELLARKCGARIALLNFETPDWFNALSPVPRDPALWEGWKFTARRASIVLSLSHEGNRHARAFYDGCPPETLFEACHCGINSPVADSVPEMPREKRILMMTRFAHAEHKGISEIEEVLCEAMRGYTLTLMVGQGAPSRRRMAALEKMAARYGITIETLFQLSDAEKYHELKRAALLLFPSFFEGFGLPPVEALYCGAPCAAFDLPVLHEVCGDALFYAPPGDWSAFREKIAEALATPPDRRRLHEQVAPVVRFDCFADRLNHVLTRAFAPEIPDLLQQSNPEELLNAIAALERPEPLLQARKPASPLVPRKRRFPYARWIASRTYWETRVMLDRFIKALAGESGYRRLQSAWRRLRGK